MTNVPHSRAVQMLRSEGNVITIVASRQQKGNTTSSSSTNVAATPVVVKDTPTVQSSIVVKLNKSSTSIPKNPSQVSQENKKPLRINETSTNGIKTVNEKKIVDHHVEVCV